MKSALVTGAAGFLGRHVARRLAADGYCVSGIGHGAWTPDEQQYWGISRWYEADVRSDTLGQMEGGAPAIIVHCAGGASVAASEANPERDFQLTADSMMAVLAFALHRAPHARVVYPSSAAVYGQVHQMPIRESTPTIPMSAYGAHKLIAERLCVDYARLFGLRASVVRFFSLYGPGLRKQLLWDAGCKLALGKPSFSGTGNEIRDWLHVEDAARLLVVAANHADIAVPIVNGASGEGATVRDILQLLASGFDGAARPLEFTGEVRGGDPRAYVADVAASHAWGWRPERELADGVAEYARWFAGLHR